VIQVVAARPADGAERRRRRPINSNRREELLDILLPNTLKSCLSRACRVAASEQAARMVAMKAATDSASDMITSLTREYNGARQGSITTPCWKSCGPDALAKKE